MPVLASGQLLLLGWGLGKGMQIVSDNPKEIRLPLPLRVALSLSLVLTAFLVSLSLRHIVGNLLLLGMIFSFIGDMFNAGVIPLKNPRIGAIAAFAPAQCLYIAAFYTLVQNSLTRFTWLIPILFFAATVISWRLLIFNREKHPALNYGSLFYSLLLGTMVSFALIAGLHLGGWWWIVTLGALLFHISDSIIGLTDFGGRAMKRPHLWIWLCYIPAQMGILYGAWLGLTL